MRTLRQALQQPAPAVAVSLPAPRPGDLDDWLALAEGLAPRADAVHIAMPPGTGARVAPLALSALLLRRGIDPAPVLDAGGRNRIALHSDLLGLRALGVTALVIDAASGPACDGSVDVDEAIATARELAEEDWNGERHEFLVGAMAEPSGGREIAARNLQAGARFLLTRPATGPDALRDFVAGLVEDRSTWRCSVLVTLAAPRGAARRESIDSLAGQLAAASGFPGVSGFNLAGLPDAQALGEILDAAGLPARP